jgi:hypothetical protein
MQEVPVPERRGFDFSDFGTNNIEILMVKAPIQQVSSKLAKLLHGKLKIDVLSQDNNTLFGRHTVVHQYAGHDWTIVFPGGAMDPVIQLSESLKTSCIYMQHGDTASCSRYQLFHQGVCIEEFDWGCDYTEEFFGIDPKNLLEFAQEQDNRGEPLSDYWDPRKWHIYCLHGLCSYKFRSNICSVKEADVLDEKNFLNTLLCAQDAWLPDWKYLPWTESFDISNVNIDDFVRIDFIKGRESQPEVLAAIDEYYTQSKLVEFDTAKSFMNELKF